MKKFISVFAGICLSATVLLTGCGGSATGNEGTKAAENSTAGSGAGDGLTAVGSFPIAKDKITLKFFMPQSPQITDFSTNEFTQYMEEKTNIHVEFETAPGDSVKEKINLIMASGDLPDAFLNTGIDEARFGVDEKLLLPINSLIDTQMTEFKKVLEKHDGLQGIITATDGNIYGLPAWNDCFHCTYQQKMWINQAWLDKLGLKTPETTDEFYQVLKTFKEKVPGAIPIAGALDGWCTNPDTFIMNAFILDTGLSSPMRTYIQDGKIQTNADKAEYKDGLAFLNKLYKEGLLYQGSFTQKTDQLKQLIASPDEPVLCVPGGANVNWIDINATPEAYKHYITLAPLTGPSGLRQSTYYKYFAAQQMGFAVSKNCKYPEAALRWADYLYSEEGQKCEQIGKQGSDWDSAETGAVGLNGKPALYKRIRPYSNEPQNVNWQDTGIIYAPEEYRLGEATDPNVDKFAANGLERLLYEETKTKYEPYASKGMEVVPPLKLLTEETQELQTIQVELEKYVTESRTRFIMGDISLDKDWDKYVKSLENMGLPKYLEYQQKAYERQYKK